MLFLAALFQLNSDRLGWLPTTLHRLATPGLCVGGPQTSALGAVGLYLLVAPFCSNHFFILRSH